jgi:Tol biopolymer transport system component
MKRITFICFMLVTVIAMSCARKDLPKLTGPYLGQKPPGTKAEIFAPGIVSTGEFERALVFAPQGSEAFFQMRGRGYRMYIIHLQRINGYWAKPEMAFFSGVTGYDDEYPFFSPDGERLYFTSKRPIEDGGDIQDEGDIWFIEKTNGAWGIPCWSGPIVNSEAYEGVPSISSSGNLYFSSNRESKAGDWGIYVSRVSNGQYTKPEKLPPPIDSNAFEGHPFIAPDESYLLFDSNREDGYGDTDIYVSFREDGLWTEAINLGDIVNTPSHEVAPYVSPDGKYLFFTTFKWNPESYRGRRFDYEGLKKMLASPGNGRGDIYWVDAKIIDGLKQNTLKRRS